MRRNSRITLYLACTAGVRAKAAKAANGGSGVDGSASKAKMARDATLKKIAKAAVTAAKESFNVLSVTHDPGVRRFGVAVFTWPIENGKAGKM